MASVPIEICRIDEVRSHGNADRLEIVRIKGWQTCVAKATQSVGDAVVYVPPDACVPLDLAEDLGVVGYLSERTNIDGDRVLVTKRIKLRGEPSFGFVFSHFEREPGAESPALSVGADVGEHYGITKFEPPERCSGSGTTNDHPLFDRYTNIENLRHNPQAFGAGEWVVITEKIHGANSRVGMIDGEIVAGSHKYQRVAPENPATDQYWYPTTVPGVAELLSSYPESYVIVLYGEVYGKVQKLHYGASGRFAYAAFDLTVNGVFQDHWAFVGACENFGVPRVPLLATERFSMPVVAAAAEGSTTLDDTHIREGVVVRPVKERSHRNGRLIMKYLSDEYLTDKKLTKADTTDV